MTDTKKRVILSVSLSPEDHTLLVQRAAYERQPVARMAALLIRDAIEDRLNYAAEHGDSPPLAPSVAALKPVERAKGRLTTPQAAKKTGTKAAKVIGRHLAGPVLEPTGMNVSGEARAVPKRLKKEAKP